MARITDYDSLVAAVKDELDTAELDVSIDRFIQFAEADFNRTLRTWEMECRTTQPLIETPQAGEDPDFYPFPPDMIELRVVRIQESNYPYLTKVEPTQADKTSSQYIHEYDDYPGNYVHERNGLMLLPSRAWLETNPPFIAGTLDLLYYRTISALDGVTNTSNWLLAKYPDIYYHGVLTQAAPYLYEDVRVPLWGSALKTSIDAVNVLNRERVFSDTQLSSQGEN